MSAEDDITVLRRVRSSVEARGRRGGSPLTCADFSFQPLFGQVEQELKAGVRKALRFGRDASVADGNFFIMAGSARCRGGRAIKAQQGGDAQLRVIYIMAPKATCSVDRYGAPVQDDTGRHIRPDVGRCSATQPSRRYRVQHDHVRYTQQIRYRSLAAHRELIHKIGVTAGGKGRISRSKQDATYLLADVGVVATYKLQLEQSEVGQSFTDYSGAAQWI